MASLGDIGRRIAGDRSLPHVRASRAVAAVAGDGAEPGAAVVVASRGVPIAVVRADGAGDWVLSSGLNDGTYWASEIGSPRGWSIVVAGTSVTVTLEEGSGGGGTVVAGYAYAWGG